MVLNFTREGERDQLPCDQHVTFDENLRAIVLTLEALRQIERYCVARNDEQYRGFLAAPGVSPGDDDGETLRESLALLSGLGGCSDGAIRSDIKDRRRAYARDAWKVHPDCGGSDEAFRKVRTAGRLPAFLIHGQVVKP